jgi:hypothetical protein
MQINFVIHVNDRTQFIEEAIKSAVFNSSFARENLFVSCNSKEIIIHSYISDLANKYGINYRKSFTKSAFDHLSESVDLCNKPYICLLHDDDYLGNNFLKEVIRLINAHPQGAAYAVDTIFDINGKLNHPAIKLIGDFRLSPLTLSLLYLLGRCGPAFPSVAYRTDFIRYEIKKSHTFGKYSDAPILIEATKQGLWLSPRKEFYYRMHSENDSKTTDLISKKLLKKHLTKIYLSHIFDYSSYSNIYNNFKYFIGRFFKSKDFTN